ncbi:hypothetical protein MP638_004560, partial [Amoeboaphelidium occidentale]
RSVTEYGIVLTTGLRDALVDAIARFVYRTGIPFRVVTSESFKDIFQLLYPPLVAYLPSEKVLSGSALNKRYLALKEQAQSMLNSAQMYSIVTDGWSNIRNEHLDEVAEQILRVIDEIGSKKCVSVVTDNASVMKAAWNIIERRKPHIFANGCADHWMNLL